MVNGFLNDAQRIENVADALTFDGDFCVSVIHC
jgi:hypothetical protein